MMTYQQKARVLIEAVEGHIRDHFHDISAEKLEVLREFVAGGLVHAHPRTEESDQLELPLPSTDIGTTSFGPISAVVTQSEEYPDHGDLRSSD